MDMSSLPDEEFDDMEHPLELTPEMLAEIAKYEAEAKQWRVEDVGHRAEDKVALPRHKPAPQTANGVLTLEMMAKHCLPPEEYGDLTTGGASENVIEQLLKVKQIRLEDLDLVNVEELESMIHVTHVYLQHNALTRIHGVEFMQTLSVLVLNGNQIEAIEGIADIPLHYLDVSNNKIATFDIDALPTHTLRFLNVQGNPFCAMVDYKPIVIEACQDLVSLDCEEVERPADSEEEPAVESELETRPVTDADLGLAEEADTPSKQSRPGTGVPIAGGDFCTVRSVTDKLIDRYVDKTVATFAANAKSERDGEEEDNAPPQDPAHPSNPTDGAKSAEASAALSEDRKGIRTDLRRAMVHQGHAAHTHMEDVWEGHDTALRQRREDMRQRRMADSAETRKPSAAYLSALESLKRYSGQDSLDKYRTQQS